MLSRLIICLFTLLLSLVPLSCTKIAESPTVEGGDITIGKLPYLDSIPVNWGRLVSVSRLTDFNVYQLWFQDEDGTVRIAFYNLDTNRFLPKVRQIARK